MPESIDPKMLMQELSITELCQTADEYYRKLPNPLYQMSKPFANTLEAPELLYKMGLLLSGLHLGKSMVVLDFGSGPCWFSRFLSQMQCITISVEVSKTALRYGRDLFDELPILGETLQSPRFVHFDGKAIDVDDQSVDRIICFDTFHHVPNQEQILREFYRVLKPGGMVGFSEPGIHHSQTPQAQYEMRNYRVLENDIRLDEIQSSAIAVGFGDLRIKLVHDINQDLNYEEYARTTRKWYLQPFRILKSTRQAMRHSTVFFLTKGIYLPDSRSHIGLAHRIDLLDSKHQVKVDEPLKLEVRVTNLGFSKWLHQNIQEIGVVKIGVHLYDLNGRLLELDFARCPLDEDVMPGQAITRKFAVTFTQPDSYRLAVDLVAEQIVWFENLGSQPRYLDVKVET